MLTIVIFFIAGVLLGMLGLRLLNMWEAQHHDGPRHNHSPRHHS
jgi:hypothetical protein